MLFVRFILVIAQLISYNISKNAPTGDRVRHGKHLFPCTYIFHAYLSMFLHSKTRKNELVDQLHMFGVGISYDRVLQISSDMYFEEVGVVCPPQLQRKIFTTGVVDNIDHNLSSTTSISSILPILPSYSGRYQFNTATLQTV